jgi:hypothetical protein
MNVQPKREGFQDPNKPEPIVTAEPPPIESAPPPDPIEQWPVRVKLLHKPIKNNHGELIHELAFREPTAGDINRYGNPCRVNVEGEVVIDEQKMMRVIAALSGVLIPLLEPMDPRDWNSCSYRLRNFFLPEVAAWLEPMRP